jgi:glycyl-tRNA synthetase alpha chain
MLWNETMTYGQVRQAEEVQFSVYNFERADVPTLWKLLELNEQECRRLLDAYREWKEPAARSRFPLLPAYDLVLKCSHLFNMLDARGALSVTERAAVIGRVRTLACGAAAVYLEPLQASVASPEGRAADEKESPAVAS